MATVLRPGPIQEKSGWGIADPQCVRRRVWLCIGVLCCAFLGLVMRLWYLQIVKGTTMLAQAQHNRIRSVPLPAPRGLVLDRHGRVLATSRASHSVAIVPAALPSARKESEERQRILKTLSFLLRTTPEEIEAHLGNARGGYPYDPVRIAEDVDLKTIMLVEENKPRLKQAVLVTDDIKRVYPNGPLAAHVLGHTGIVAQRDLDRAAEKAKSDPNARKLNRNDVIGKSGIERQYDEQLSGIPGSEQYEVDARLRPVRHRGSIREKPGSTVMLTLDAKLQQAAEEALAEARNSGAAAVIDPRNGEVLALASRPSFDPNIWSLSRSEFNRRYREIDRNSKDPLLNRAVTSAFPPGSTFKMITAAAGLQKGATDPSISYNCGGSFRMGRSFGCWSTHGRGINLSKAIAESCNVYFYQTALRLGNPESSGPAYLAEVAREFGLGQNTGIDLPTDGAGLIPDPEWRKRYYAGNPDLARWHPGNTLNMSIGQGDVLASPLQMALVTGAVANGGTLWQPHLIQEVRGGQFVEPQPNSRSVGIERQYLDLVRAGMRRVVTDGTGKTVAMEYVAVAGKTGSAEDAKHPLPHAWFVCFAPYNNPRIAIAVIVENSGHGSSNAAPVARKILEAAFPEPETPSDSRSAQR